MALSKDDLILNFPSNELSFEITSVVQNPVILHGNPTVNSYGNSHGNLHGTPYGNSHEFSHESEIMELDFASELNNPAHLQEPDFNNLLKRIENNPILKEIKISIALDAQIAEELRLPEWPETHIQSLYNAIQKSKAVTLSFIGNSKGYVNWFALNRKGAVLALLPDLLENSNITTLNLNIQTFGFMFTTAAKDIPDSKRLQMFKRLCESIANGRLTTLNLMHAIPWVAGRTEFGSTVLSYLWQAIGKSHLESLNISETRLFELPDHLFSEFIAAISNSNLKELKLYYSAYIGERGSFQLPSVELKVEAFLKALSEPTCLVESLQLSYALHWNDFLMKAYENYLNTKKLKHLSLKGFCLERYFPSYLENFTSFFESIAKSGVESLDLSYTGLQFLPISYLQVIGNSFAHSKIKYLNLGGNTFSTRHIHRKRHPLTHAAALLELIKPLEHTALETLVLPFCDVRDEDMLLFDGDSPLITAHDYKDTHTLIRQLAQLSIHTLTFTEPDGHPWLTQPSMILWEANKAIQLFMNQMVYRPLMNINIEGISTPPIVELRPPSYIVQFPLQFNQNKVRNAVQELHAISKGGMPEVCMGLILNYYHACFDTQTARKHALLVEDDDDIQEPPKKKPRIEL